MTTIVERGIMMFQRGPRLPMSPMHPMNRMNGLPRFHPHAGNQMMPRGGSSFLSRFFSKQGARPGMAGQPFQQGTGGLLSRFLSNPESASGMFNNIQKAVNVANQFTPMIQQYGPMIRNIPSLIKLYKEINSSDDEVQDEAEAKEVPIAPKKEKPHHEKSVPKGSSKPKLYI